jgi:hypothetical protein
LNAGYGMYDAQIGRFTSRDPVRGQQDEPMTLHSYLYCLNDPIDGIDPTGRSLVPSIGRAVEAGYEAHYGAIGVTAYGVAINNNAMISLGIEMEKTVSAVIAISMLSSRSPKGWDKVERDWDNLEGANRDNWQGNWNNFKFPKGWGKGAKWAAAIGVGTLAIQYEWHDFVEFIGELKEGFDNWLHPQEWVPSPSPPR